MWKQLGKSLEDSGTGQALGHNFWIPREGGGWGPRLLGLRAPIPGALGEKGPGIWDSWVLKGRTVGPGPLGL